MIRENASVPAHVSVASSAHGGFIHVHFMDRAYGSLPVTGKYCCCCELLPFALSYGSAYGFSVTLTASFIIFSSFLVERMLRAH